MAENAPQNAREAPQGASHAIATQMEHQWKSLLRMMTAQGATRRELMGMTVATATAVVSLTAEALWPQESDVPPEEAEKFVAVANLEGHLAEAMKVIQG